jgi:LemA protein
MFSVIVFSVAFVLFGALLILALYFVLIFNRLVSLKHETLKAWSNIDVLIRQRHEELPKLVEACKQYLRHERETLSEVLQARADVSNANACHDIKRLGEAEVQLRRSVSRLLAVVEAYPVLRADQSFRRLEERISGLENAIADRREFFNDCVNSSNVRREQFPDLIVARLFGFEAFELLQFDAEEQRDVSLRELFV